MASQSLSGGLLKVRFETFAVITLSLPLLSLVACVFLSLYYDFERSVATHCNVANYLPSLSSSIGGFTPQRYIWRTGIAIHSAPRLFVAFLYLNFYRTSSAISHNRLLLRLAYLNFALNLLENAALVILTYVSSTENYKIHEAMFVCFVAFSVCYMIDTLFLFWRLCREYSADTDLKKSLRYKFVFFVVNVSVFLISLYFFFRHNWYCEPGVYTMFAICEYLVVLSNIAFHGTAYLDFKDVVLIAKSNQDSYAFKKLHNTA
ncbi:post-GPI attachment to proteins factor 2-like [Paramacrobiotus metropolitanus]|uniref:post-GPI attachment to proteins factor 2-like n=1 Tax=Paramacrobiotus metropolitanus TaxID=2943436 RepID=UPI002445C484|nr:post-GPI attachment to proteins factor 2-like [Paramacrobiotus metropolitanus]